MMEQVIETSLEPDEAQPPLRRVPGEAFAALAEALAAAEETAPEPAVSATAVATPAVDAASTGVAERDAAAAPGWDGVISRAIIAFSPLALFR